MLGKTKGFPVQFLLEPLSWALHLRPLPPSSSFSPPFLTPFTFVFSIQLSSSHLLTFPFFPFVFSFFSLLHSQSSFSSSLIFFSFFSLSQSSNLVLTSIYSLALPYVALPLSVLILIFPFVFHVLYSCSAFPLLTLRYLLLS